MVLFMLLTPLIHESFPMLNLRKIHLYLGTFFAPAIIFFAFTGLLQVVGLHESHERGAPPPYPWIAKLAQLHKDQKLRALRPPASAPQAGHAAARPGTDAAPNANAASNPNAPAPAANHEHDEGEAEAFVPLKLFVLLMALGLIATSFIGIYIAVQNPRTKRAAWLSVALGLVVPVLMIVL
jgi:hypothetical protein